GGRGGAGGGAVRRGSEGSRRRAALFASFPTGRNFCIGPNLLGGRYETVRRVCGSCGPPLSSARSCIPECRKEDGRAQPDAAAASPRLPPTQVGATALAVVVNLEGAEHMGIPYRARVDERAFLNLPGFHGGAYVVAYVEDTSEGGPRCDKYNCDGDCSHPLENFEARTILEI